MNQQYDQLQVMFDAGDLDWLRDNIVALLGTGGTFTSTDTTVSDSGFVTSKQEPLAGRTIEDGSLIANAVLFTNVTPGVDHQLLLVKALPSGSPLVLGWFDEDYAQNPLRVDNPGSFIVRPFLADEAPASPPDSGVWLTVQT